MATEVIKRDGSREPFDREKIASAIRGALDATDVAADRAAEVVDMVTTSAVEYAQAKTEIATSEIRDFVLGELDRVEAAASAAWRAYDEEHGKA